nr:MAG TPA: hypothetical protein [Caudoviricetes sp.]
MKFSLYLLTYIRLAWWVIRFLTTLPLCGNREGNICTMYITSF